MVLFLPGQYCERGFLLTRIMFDRSVDRADMSDNAWRRPIRAPSPDFLKRTQVIIGNQKPQHPAPAFLRFPQRVFWPEEIANKPFQADRPRKGGAFRFLVAWTTTGNMLGSTAISTGSLTHKLGSPPCWGTHGWPAFVMLRPKAAGRRVPWVKIARTPIIPAT
jgi:hypothetical protein